MKIKYLFASILLLFVGWQVRAQVSLGIKTSTIFSEFTNENHFGIINRMNNGENWYTTYETGFSVSGVIQINFNNCLKFRAEPGITKRNNYFSPEENMALFDVFIPEGKVNRIYLESPLKFIVRAPLFKNKIGLYSSMGLNPTKYVLTRHVEPSANRPMIEKKDGKFLEDWELKKLIGFGADINFGRHQIFFDCDFATKIDTQRFVGSNDFKLKDWNLGLGYLILI